MNYGGEEGVNGLAGAFKVPGSGGRESSLGGRDAFGDGKQVSQ